MVTQVELYKIEIPRKWRRVKQAAVDTLADSLSIDGLLQPIGVRPHPSKDGTYVLVFGRHRLDAAKKLGWTAIDAQILSRLVTDDAAEGATIAENLFRVSLNAAERVLGMKKWRERYAAANPTTAVPGVKAESGGGPAFPEHAAAETGMPIETVRRILKAGTKLTDDQLSTLASAEGVNLGHVKAVNKLPGEARQQAVTLIAGGVPPREAISQATLPDDAKAESAGDPADGGRVEADLSDDEWLETYCGEVLARLKYQAAYRKDAVLYRKTRDARAKFRAAMKNPLAQGKAQAAGPFFLLMAKAVNVDHPSRWLPCGPCGGTGQDGNRSQCGQCRGHAFAVKTAGGAR